MVKVLLAGNALLLALIAVFVWQWASEGGAFQGNHVVYIGAGLPEHPFSQRLERGARDAAADLDCTLDILWNGWDPSTTAKRIKQAVEMAPDAICVPGFPRTPAFDTFVRDAERRGIVVTSYNVTAPEFMREFGVNGFGFAGQDNFEAAGRLVRALVAKLDLEPGDRAVVFGMPSAAERARRAEGCVAALESAGLMADMVDTHRGPDEAPPQPRALVSEYLDAHPDVKLMIWESYPTYVAAQVLRELGYDAGEIPVAGWDLNPEILDEIESGYVTLTYDQQPYLQGYLPVLQACLTHQRGLSGFFADTSGPFVDQGLLDELRPLVEQGVR